MAALLPCDITNWSEGCFYIHLYFRYSRLVQHRRLHVPLIQLSAIFKLVEFGPRQLKMVLINNIPQTTVQGILFLCSIYVICILCKTNIWCKLNCCHRNLLLFRSAVSQLVGAFEKRLFGNTGNWSVGIGKSGRLSFWAMRGGDGLK